MRTFSLCCYCCRCSSSFRISFSFIIIFTFGSEHSESIRVSFNFWRICLSMWIGMFSIFSKFSTGLRKSHTHIHNWDFAQYRNHPTKNWKLNERWQSWRNLLPMAFMFRCSRLVVAYLARQFFAVIAILLLSLMFQMHSIAVFRW